MHRDKTSSHLVCPSVCEFVPLLIAMFCQLAHQEILQFSPLLKYHHMQLLVLYVIISRM